MTKTSVDLPQKYIDKLRARKLVGHGDVRTQMLKALCDAFGWDHSELPEDGRKDGQKTRLQNEIERDELPRRIMRDKIHVL